MRIRINDPDWLDDRIMQLDREDRLIKIGRSEGRGYQMEEERYWREGGERPKFERTPEYRLRRYYERVYDRLHGKQKWYFKPTPTP